MHKKKIIDSKTDNTFYNFYYKKDRLNQLRGFCSTYQCNYSASQAAKKLNIEAATVCKQINALERELGIKLFDRTKNNRYVPTKDGIAFYNEAIKVIQSTDSLYQNFSKDREDDRKNKLKIAGNYAFLSGKLPKYIKKLLDQEKFRDLKIEIINTSTDKGFKGLIDGTIDVGFFPLIHSHKIPVELKRKNIFKWNSIMLVSKDHPLAYQEKIEVTEFEKYPYFFLDKYIFFNPGEVLSLTPSNIKFENTSWGLIMNYIKENLGMMVILDEFMEDTTGNIHNFKKIDINRFLPLMYFAYIVKKNIKHKEAVEFLVKEMKKDSDI